MENFLERKLREAEEKFNNLCLLDNAMMNFAFKDNIPAVQHIVRVILEKPDLEVHKVNIQEYDGNHIGHSCTFDITATDSKGNHYNIEMQSDSSGTSTRRSRYHSSMIDNKLLPKNKNYDVLPDSYVIFITRGDVLGYHLPIMHIDKTIRENNREYDDGSYIIYVNANFNSKDTPLGTLMHDLTQVNADNITDSQELHDALYCIKSNERRKNMFIDNYCGNEEKLWKEATTKIQKDNIKSLFANGFSAEQIAKGLEMSVEAIKQILKEK